jgi:RNA polymerase sigma-70 factor (ECF subfamily)
MISEEEQKKIIKTIESLDVNYQEIIRLRFFEEKASKKLPKNWAFLSPIQKFG